MVGGWEIRAKCADGLVLTREGLRTTGMLPCATVGTMTLSGQPRSQGFTCHDGYSSFPKVENPAELDISGLRTLVMKL